MRALGYILALPCCATLAQGPLTVDTTFALPFDFTNVNDLEFLPSGKILVAGTVHMPGAPPFDDYSTDRLLPDGSQDTTFNTWGGGTSGEIMPWNNKYYVEHSQGVVRLDSSGLRDYSFYPEGVNFPFFGFGQGGDAHLYPDGRVLFSGLMARYDTDTNYTGDVGLVRFLPDGLLDSTFHEPMCFNSIDQIHPLANGKFLLDGILNSYDGHPVDGPFRVFADCSIDTSFHCPMPEGRAVSFLELPDGKLIMTGAFRLGTDPDIRHVARLHPDGSLDATFNSHLEYEGPDFANSDLYSPVRQVLPIGASRYAVVGDFVRVEGFDRRSICMIDTAGDLIHEHFFGTGCDTIIYPMGARVGLRGMQQAPDGSYYIYGGYHGFHDGYNYHPDQIMVTRLHGGNVGMEEQHAKRLALRVWPNPTSDVVQVELPSTEKLTWRLSDALGRQVPVAITMRANATLDLSELPAGVYVITASSSTGTWAVRLLKE